MFYLVVLYNQEMRKQKDKENKDSMIKTFVFVGCGAKKEVKGQVKGTDILDAVKKIDKEHFNNKGYDIRYVANRADVYYKNGRKAFVVFAERK